MSNVLEFMTSSEMMVVGIIILTASLLALIVFLIEKSYYKHKNKSKNIDINEIVEEMEKEEQDKKIVEETPNVSTVNTTVECIDNTVSSKNDINPQEEVKHEEEKPLVIPIEEFNEKTAGANDTGIETLEENSVESIFNEVKEEVEQLQYVDAEPNREEAKEELRKVTEELIKNAEEENNNNISLTKFEEEQEENAIISMDELMKKSEVLYQQNEVTQYEDEGNEPISLEDLELRMKNIKNEINAIETEDKIEAITENKEEVVIDQVKPKVVLKDLNTVQVEPKKAYSEDVVFKSSPIISPIFGIEDNKNDNNMELENTANYDKLDEEIKKTNSFLAVLKELQKKLD